MKPNIKTLLAAGIIGLATSCTDLNVDIDSQYTKYPDSDIAVAAKMASIYNTFAASLGRSYDEVQSLSSDEYVGLSFDGSYTDQGRYSNQSLHTFTPLDGNLDYYGTVSSGIAQCNFLINDLGGDKADPAKVAEAKTMRAFFHFILMDSFGDTPILDHVPAEEESIDRKPRADVAKFIESELKAAIPYLSEANNEATYGKPNKWMAEALLVKLYINWPVYTAKDVTLYDASQYSNEKLNDCVKYCDNIIKSKLFSLSEGANGYHSKFFANNGPQVKDFIYAMPFDATNLTGMTYSRFRTWKKANTGVSYYGWKITSSCAGVFAMTPEMANLFDTPEAGDRASVVMGGTIKVLDSNGNKTNEDWKYNGKTEFIQKTITLKSQDHNLNVGEDENGYNQGWKSIKFLPVESDINNHSRNMSNDVPIFRYADILLTKAEAIKRGANATNGDTPMSLFNQIRAYANAPLLTSEPTLTQIYDERGREFLDEHWRRNDMIRFGTFEGDFGYHKRSFVGSDGKQIANFDKTRRIFPIPTSILNQNTNWKQNAGY